MKIFCIFLVILLSNVTQLSCEEENPYLEVIKPWKSIQEYVEVRPGVFLFYWFYYADGTTFEAEKKPLVIWIQGGPGLAASGIANFAEIGPVTMDMQPRNHTWVRGRNLLLIDHPVGTGFSYTTDNSSYVRSDRAAVKDLVRLIREFFKKHKYLSATPTYVIGQSYGSKLTPRLALHLHTYIEKNRLKMNFKGIGLGSGWVDPKQSSLAQPDYLYHMGILDKRAHMQLTAITAQICRLIDKKEYDQIPNLKMIIIMTIYREAKMLINYNNINQHNAEPILRKLNADINKYVKPTLSVVNQSLQWNYISEEVFNDMTPDFYVSTTKYVEALLNQTSLKIAIYNGNLDVVTPLVGASNWVHNLKWAHAEEFMLARRNLINGHRNGYYKSVGRLSFWSVFGAGHWVPEDNPKAMEHILEYLMATKENDNSPELSENKILNIYSRHLED
ncbi:retinoid-inducible serine carboxypeptidase-like [Aricia agestis]|uniref:retinoid-inducible serine carboxypeptidase-like n=1 Tax=Aricia agestis TaxID=91739 RepID=UPI001C202BB4|nr:retinoid-inducible serine carboxypeptidase-like [Aricia agestis]